MFKTIITFVLLIALAHTIDITLTGDTTLSVLALTNAALLTGGSFTIKGSSTVTLNADVKAKITAASGVTVALTSAAKITANNALTIQSGATMKASAALTVDASASMNVEGTFLLEAGGSVTGSGDFNVNTNGKVQVTSAGTSLCGSSGKVVLQGSTSIEAASGASTASVVINGDCSVTGSGAHIKTKATLEKAFNVEANGKAYWDAEVLVKGKTTIKSTGGLVVTSASECKSDVECTGSATLSLAAQLKAVSLTLSSDTQMQVKGNGNGKAVCSGAAKLAGKLFIEGGASVSAGTQVTICEYASFSGQFSAVASGTISSKRMIMGKRAVVAVMHGDWEMTYGASATYGKRSLGAKFGIGFVWVVGVVVALLTL